MITARVCVKKSKSSERYQLVMSTPRAQIQTIKKLIRPISPQNNNKHLLILMKKTVYTRYHGNDDWVC